VAGNARAAQDCLAELDALDAAGADTAPWRLHVHAGLGDAEAVIGCMESMVERRSAAAVHVFTTPYIDFVRNDSRVVRLFQAIGLEHLAKMS
jgi:hypothetical protein